MPARNMTDREKEVFVENCALSSSFDYHENDDEENEPAHWCVRQEMFRGDTEVVALVFDTSASSIRSNRPEDSETDWVERELLTEMFARAPEMLKLIIGTYQTIKAGGKVENYCFAQMEELIMSMLGHIPEDLPY
jgi:hypothetical protein